MKVAVTAKGKGLNSHIDQRFGRAKFLIFADTETGDFEIYDNTVNLNAAQGARIQNGQNIANLDVDVVVTGNIGPNAFKTLDAANVKVYLSKAKIIQEAIGSYKAGELNEVTQANVEGHWS